MINTILSKLSTFFQSLKGFWSLKSSGRSVWKLIGTLILGLIVMLYTIWFSLPPEKIKESILKSIEANLEEGWSVTIAELDNNLLGLELKGVSLFNNEKLAATISAIKIYPVNWRLLMLGVPIDATIYDGEIRAVYYLWSKDLSINNASFNINFIPIVSSSRLIAGPTTIELQADYSLTSTTANLKIPRANIKLNNNSILSSLPFKLPENIAVSNFESALSFNPPENQLLSTLSGDITGTINTKFNWGGNFAASNFNSEIRLKLSPKLISESEDLINIFLKDYIEGENLNINLQFDGSFNNYSINKIGQ